MSIGLLRNIASLKAERRLSEASGELARVFERLSSGQRINRASDDAAGLAVASELAVDARLYTTSVRNLSDGISMLSIADATLEQQSNLVMRLKELANQSSSGTLSNTQRSSLNNEYQALLSEFGRLGDTTTFNGLDLLRGSRSGSAGSIALQAGISGASTSTLRMSSPDSGSLSGIVSLGWLPNNDFNDDGSNDGGDTINGGWSRNLRELGAIS